MNNSRSRSPIEVLALLMLASPVRAEAASPVTSEQADQPTAAVSSDSEQDESQLNHWRYGAFVDLGYSRSSNSPANKQFRNRGTTPRVNELNVNMAGVSIQKVASHQSRWGMELLGQGGQDSREFGFAVNSPRLESSDVLRHLGRANVSYLAPAGNGLLIQGGIFNSLIGYDSLYSKDNSQYSRPWIADYSPYLMLGLNASYPFNDRLSGTLFVINKYFHLDDSNRRPNYGGQLAWKSLSGWAFKETVLFGPNQVDTSTSFWRLFADTIAEWKGESISVAFEHQIGTEELAEEPGEPQALWTGLMVQVRWNASGRWSAAVRPEYFYDRDGRITGSRQTVRAITTTLGYRLTRGRANAILRLEHRYDRSTGPDGGFFEGDELSPGVVGLTPAQHLFIVATIWTFDSP